MDSKERLPAVAGKFYPGEPDILEEQITGLFATAGPRKTKYVRAIISPHVAFLQFKNIHVLCITLLDLITLL